MVDNILNYKFICDEKNNIDKLDNEVEKKIRIDLLDEIIEKMNDYDVHISKYEYQQKRDEIVHRGVEFIDGVEKVSFLKKKWIKMFTGSIDSIVKKEIYFDDFFWHIFSYEKLKAKTGEEAIKAFNNSKKSKVYIFYQHDTRTYLIKNPKFLLASDFDLDDDIYIFDVDEQWTYIHTHEEQCGPYFHYVDKQNEKHQD